MMNQEMFFLSKTSLSAALRFHKLGGALLLQQQSEVVVSDLDLLRETLVANLKLHVVPGEVGIAEEVFVDGEGADLIFQSLSQLLTSLGDGGGGGGEREGGREDEAGIGWTSFLSASPCSSK